MYYQTQTFNRTIIELKRPLQFLTHSIFHSFNRTIVELKHANIRASYRFAHPFNRTVVELKLSFQLLNATLCFKFKKKISFGE